MTEITLRYADRRNDVDLLLPDDLFVRLMWWIEAHRIIALA